MLKIESKSKFRISAKKLFLTYPGIKEKLNREDILSEIAKKLPVSKYLIAEERHKDGSYHYHCVFVGHKKFEIRNPNLLDLQTDGISYHGNYQKVRNLNATIQYCMKADKGVLHNFQLTKTGRFKNEYHEILDLAAKDAEAAIDMFKDVNPKDYLLNVNKIERNLRLLNIRESLQSSHVPKLEDLIYPDKLQEYLDRGFLKEFALVLSGGPGTGKTTLAKAILDKYCSEYVVIRNKEQLESIVWGKTEGIILDDWNILNLSRIDKINLTDIKEEGMIEKRYNNGIIQKGIIRIFTMNEDIAQFHENDGAIIRRIFGVNIDTPVFKDSLGSVISDEDKLGRISKE